MVLQHSVRRRAARVGGLARNGMRGYTGQPVGQLLTTDDHRPEGRKALGAVVVRLPEGGTGPALSAACPGSALAGRVAGARVPS